MAVVIAIIDDRSLAEVAPRVGQALGVSLQAHESSYWGDPYYSAWPASELRLTSNSDPQYQPGDPLDERYFVPTAEDAAFVLWDVADEAEALEALRAAGFDARIVSDA